MTATQNHIICTQSVEVEFYNQKENLFLQDKIANMVKDRLLPALDVLFTEKAPAAKCIKIESLDIDIGHITATNWEEEFIEQTIKKTRLKLDEIINFAADEEAYEVTYNNNQPNIQPIDTIDTNINTFLHFIRTGTTPWNAQHSNMQDILAAIVTEGKRIDPAVFLQSPAAFERLVLQFDESLVIAFLQSLFQLSDLKTQIEKQKKIVAELRLPADKKAVLPYVLSVSQMTDADSFTALKKMAQEQPFTQPKLNELTKEKTIAQQGDYFIQNAGLVILHPFLQTIFTALHYTDESNFIDAAIQRKAVLLTQYIVTEKTEIPEQYLVLNKILCGYPISGPVENNLEISLSEQQEVNDLLQSVIQYWTALKTTSIAGLRNSFLQRNGKLTEYEDYWLLQAEQQSYDVLMNYLPWGIGIIKLPWMQKRLVVGWNA